MKRNLHIFVPSQLHINGGGIETWLVYFLRGISSIGKYQTIFVYGFQSNGESRTICELKFDNTIKFHLSALSKKRNGALNILKFVHTHGVRLKKNVNEGDQLIIVGSVFLAPFYLRIKSLINKKKLNTVLWIRSKTVGEMKARSSKYVFLAKFFETIMIKNTEVIIANGKDTLSFYSDLYPKHCQKMTTVFNAVNYRKYSKIEIVNSIDQEIKIKVIFLGRYIRAKGFDNFIESIHQLTNENINDNSIEFIAYGHGEMRTQIGKIPLVDKGPYTQNELYDLLKQNNAFIFLNKSENAGGLSHALLEVMAAGKIVIAWKNKVHCQVLNDRNSILVEEGNITKLTEAYKVLIENLKENEYHYDNLRRNARKTAEIFSEENHINNFLRLVDK